MSRLGLIEKNNLKRLFQKRRPGPSSNSIRRSGKIKEAQMRRNGKLVGGTITISFVTLLAALPSLAQTGDDNIDRCRVPLGMESGRIKDEDLRASSSYNYRMLGPQFARLNTESGSGAWCPDLNLSSSSHVLQIELHEVYIISAISIQGRFGLGNGAEFAREFSMEYYRPSLGKWLQYQHGMHLPANSDTFSVTTHYLDPVIFASAIRILPYSDNTTICIRTEIYGCLLGNDLISYSYYGSTADYIIEPTEDSGLGLLVDKNTQNGFLEWIHNSSAENNNSDTIFEFGSIRSFHSVDIYFSTETKVDDFEIVILVSMDGEQFSEVSRSKDLIVQSGHVRIEIDNNWFGKFAKLQLYFSKTVFIQITEIYIGTTAGLSKRQLEYITGLNENSGYCSNLCFHSLIGVIVFLTAALIGLGIFLWIKRSDYNLVRPRYF